MLTAIYRSSELDLTYKDDYRELAASQIRDHNEMNVLEHAEH